MVSVRKLALAAALALSAGGTLVTGTAFADPEINNRLENQQERIREGYANGSLTHDEACRLERQEQQLRHEDHHMAHHHGTSGQERAELNRQLNRESGRIHAERTNDREVDPRGRHHASLHC